MAKNNNNKPKIFLGQNMSTRVRSPLFWTGVVGIVGSAVVSFGGLIGLDLSDKVDEAVSYTHLTLPTTCNLCRSRWSPYH